MITDKPSTVLYSLCSALKAAFDERSVFPKYLLDFEQKMKQYHAEATKVSHQSLIFTLS